MSEIGPNEPPAALRERQRGDTTLKQCGWCIHAIGSHRYGYCISGRCELQKDHAPEIKWSDECKFKEMSKADIQATIEQHKYRIDDYQRSVQNRKEYIATLKKILPKAANRPALPSDRSCEHFNESDPVAVFYQGRWCFGEVKIGYRHHDGCVSYRLNSVGPQQSNFWGCGMAVPTVMLKSEYDFFAANPEQYALWCKVAYDKSFNGERIEIAPIEEAA